jgi:hypothetical protein
MAGDLLLKRFTFQIYVSECVCVCVCACVHACERCVCVNWKSVVTGNARNLIYMPVSLISLSSTRVWRAVNPASWL